MEPNKTNFTLTGIFIKDEDEGGFTAFFSTIPEAVTQGDTLEEAKQKLFSILPDVMEVKNKILEEERLFNGGSQIIKESFKFQLA